MWKTRAIMFVILLLIFTGCAIKHTTTPLEIGGDRGVKISIIPGRFWTHNIEFAGVISITATPQIAVWLESRDGNYLKTLHISSKTAEWVKEGDRPESLPVWSHKVNSIDEKLDGVTNASGRSDQNSVFRGEDNDYFIYIEINNSFDYNHHYKDNLDSGDKFYSDSSGQPSLIYSLEIMDGRAVGEFQLIGHSHPFGRDGKIRKDLSKITTAKEIVKLIKWIGR